MNQDYDRSTLEGSLSQMESAAMNFAHRFINDGKVRMNYINQTTKVAAEYRTRVTSGAISAEDAAKQVQVIRNQILEAQRLRTSDLGKAKAISMKKTGLTLTDLTEKYSQNKYGKSFLNLSNLQKNQVYLEIIDSSGRPRPAVNASALKYTKLGRGLLFVTLGIAVYNISVADDKGKAIAREGVVIGGGFAGGAAGGGLAGLACGPGAPVCVTIGVFVGGALGALGADISFGWFF